MTDTRGIPVVSVKNGYKDLYKVLESTPDTTVTIQVDSMISDDDSSRIVAEMQKNGTPVIVLCEDLESKIYKFIKR